MKVKIVKLLICLAVCLGIGIFEGVATQESVHTWYQTLPKLTGTPPDVVFPIVWTILYILIAISWWLVWISPTKDKLTAYVVFGLQLMLNFLWSWLFFFWQNPAIAFIDITFLWLFIALTIYFFYPHSPLSAYLLVPYFLWVGYALRLNFLIWLYG